MGSATNKPEEQERRAGGEERGGGATAAGEGKEKDIEKGMHDEVN